MFRLKSVGASHWAALGLYADVTVAAFEWPAVRGTVVDRDRADSARILDGVGIDLGQGRSSSPIPARARSSSESVP